MRKLLPFLLAAFLLCLGIPAAAKVYLVSVGVSNYPNPSWHLNLTVRDAATIAMLYSTNDNVQYRLLTDEDATVDNICSEMDRVYSNAKEDDIVVFFFSGHGYQGGFLAYDRRLPYAEIRQAMAKTPCKNKMIFADACFAGKMRTEGRDSIEANGEARKANVMLFLSSRPNETSREISSMRNGIFTTYLYKGLKGSADADKNNTITALELFRYVSKGVKLVSGDLQHPQMWGNFADDMPVMIW